MRQLVTRADAYGPSAGISYTGANAVQSSGADGAGATGQAAGPIPATELFKNLQLTFMAQPVYWLAALVLGLILFKLIEEHKEGKDEVSEAKIGIRNMAKIGLMAMLFFVLAKFLATKVDVPGASKFVLYATGG